ncbi:MAG: hypothetical protein ACI4GA_04455 [Acutalibacteraceae bacterium]
MKGFLKKTLSVFMVVVLSVLAVTPAFATVDEDGDALPIVYVIGKVDVIYKDKSDPNSKVIYPVSMDNIDGKTLETLTETFIDAYTHNKNEEKWDAYCDAMYDLIAGIYQDLTLNEDGEPKDNSGIIWDWKADLKDTKENGVYGLYDYTFHYDWRLDMFHNAALLNEYINAVLEVTGARKCVLISRCYGCNLVGAYLSEYGSDKIDTNILYCSTAKGSVVCGEMFCGRVELNPDGVEQYISELFGINPITAILGEIFSNSPIAVKITSAFINNIYNKICDRVMPRGLISSFASMPGYWSMVGEEYFKDAKSFVFGGQYDKYQKLIDKIDYYYYTVLTNIEDILIKANKNGMKYANITKYGHQIVPAIKSCDYIGDGIVEVPSASLGATSVKRGESFSTEYLNKAVERDTLDYISPDYAIDASTCLFPDYTWFAEGVEHFDFPKSVDRLLLAIARYDGPGQMDVNTNPEFPQYAKYEGEGNMLTWALSGYLNNSTDSSAKLMKSVLRVLSVVVAFIAAIFGSNSK